MKGTSSPFHVVPVSLGLWHFSLSMSCSLLLRKAVEQHRKNSGEWMRSWVDVPAPSLLQCPDS